MAVVDVVRGNIVEFPADVIVNAANSSLLGGGGVDGAIHRAAGPKLLLACMKLHGAKTGQAKMTDAFRIIQSKKIVHTVGPVYKGLGAEESARLLKLCYQNSLDLAEGFRSVVFPAISTGIYGYPLREATQVALDSIADWLDSHEGTSLEKITLIAFREDEFAVLSEVLEEFDRFS